MKNEQKPRIMQYILRLIAQDDRGYVRKTQETFSIGKSTVYHYLREMAEEGTVEKSAARRTGYALKQENFLFRYDNTGHLEEDRIFETDIRPRLSDLPDNAYRIWRYAFTEMMNNAIEHSGAKEIRCHLTRDKRETRIMIEDDGIGIFQNIRQYLLRKTGEEIPLRDCVAMLFAGKFTTDEKKHSGEGIFFTSHAMDAFAITGNGELFTRDNFRENQNNADFGETGTAVSMMLANQTSKELHEIFDRFSSVEEGFHRTQIPIRHMFFGEEPVSRSEARRLGEAARNFKETVLDFADVAEIGQAFAHELFVVWQGEHPDKKLEVINASERVAAMIARVRVR